MGQAFSGDKPICNGGGDDDLYIPSEIISKILSHIRSERDRYKLLLVCKSWFTARKRSAPLQLMETYQLVLQLPNPISLSPGAIRDCKVLPSPLLMSGSGSGDTYDFFHPFHHSYYMKYSELRHKSIEYSKNGWLLVKLGDESLSSSSDEVVMFFYCPLTKSRTDLLPSLKIGNNNDDYPTRFSSCSHLSRLRSGTADGDLIIAGVGFDSFASRVVVHVFISKYERWNTFYVELVPKLTADDYLLCSSTSRSISAAAANLSPIFMNGYCYCVPRNGKLARFDPDNFVNTWEYVVREPLTSLPLAAAAGTTVDQCFMVESEGRLFIVFLTAHSGGGGGRGVFVYKLMKKKKMWKEVRDIGDRVMYLSNVGESWVRRGGGGKNKIYLPLLYDDTAVVFYDLTTGTFRCNGYDFPITNDLKLLPRAAWFRTFSPPASTSSCLC